jgi:hypothetical protein
MRLVMLAKPGMLASSVSGLCLLVGLTLLGCSEQAPAKAPAARIAAPARAQPQPTPSRAVTKAATEAGPPSDSAKTRPPSPQPKAPLADLVEQAAAREFDLPAIDEARLAAAGIRKLAGKHITLYTDLPAGEVDELPSVLDAAVPLWCEYFTVNPAKVADWKIVGHVMRDKERFVGMGLYLASLPDFPNGFSQGSQLWLYDQPSAYYRRHLLLHEGTHSFMYRWLGGAGPPWYMEGLAELLGTHHWAGGKLTLAVMPQRKEDVPFWGRIKIVRDEYAANRGMMLEDVMRYDAHAHLRNEPYGWCWAAAAFFDGHPLTQEAFREFKSHVGDRTVDFSLRFQKRLAPHWREITEDWQLFVIDCDYGYDFARAAIVRKAAVPLPAEGARIELATARGWQSTGYQLQAGQRYVVSASGRYQVAGGERAWPCEAGGITLRYHDGQPLGMLTGAIVDEASESLAAGLASKRTIGLSSVLAPTESGTLFLSINEAAAGLADNRGTLQVEIRPE